MSGVEIKQVVRSPRARRSALRGQISAAKKQPEIKGLKALPGVTYVRVSDDQGLMDDDVLALLEGN